MVTSRSSGNPDKMTVMVGAPLTQHLVTSAIAPCHSTSTINTHENTERNKDRNTDRNKYTNIDSVIVGAPLSLQLVTSVQQ